MRAFLIRLFAGKTIDRKDELFRELVDLINDHGGFHNSEGGWGNGEDKEVVKLWKEYSNVVTRYYRS